MTEREPWLATFNRYAWVASVFALLGALGAFAVSRYGHRGYEAHATLWVEGIAQRDYAGEMRSIVVAPATGRLTITQASGSRFVTLRLEDTSAVGAARALNSIARKYIARMPNWPSRLVMLDSAVVPTASPSGGRVADILRFTLLALGVGLALSVILTVRDRHRS
ncbi:MAG: hypothetical protein ABIY52_05780 [Gemmatimonadaceae bacterium]